MSDQPLPDWRGPLWGAINEYVSACGGDASKHVYGNTRRQRAVVAVESAVPTETALRARIADLEQQRKQLGETLDSAVDKLAKERDVAIGMIDVAVKERDTLKARVVELIHAIGSKDKQLLEYSDEVNARGGQIDALKAERDRLGEALSRAKTWLKMGISPYTIDFVLASIDAEDPQTPGQAIGKEGVE